MDRRTAFLLEMGLGPIWHRRDTVTPETAPSNTIVAEPVEPTGKPASPEEVVPGSGTPVASEVAAMDWVQLKEAVAHCTKCALCHSRNKTVFGVGDERAKWLFIGEAPGRTEDAKGEPFVGPAGKLLDNMLLAMGLRRGENVYIANIAKCRPPDQDGKDRPPTPEEKAACIPYLQRQIELIQPSVMVALGGTAAVSLLDVPPETPVSRLRGTVHEYAGRPLIVTYHPAYLLRNLVDKRKAWADLCLAMTTYASAE